MSTYMHGNCHKEFLVHIITKNQRNINNKDANTHEDHFYPIGSSVSGTHVGWFYPHICWQKDRQTFLLVLSLMY